MENNPNLATNNVSLITSNEVTATEAPTTNLQDTNSKILELKNVLKLSGAYLPDNAKKAIEKEIETLTKQYNRLLGNDMLKAYLQPFIMKFRADNNITDLNVKFNLKIDNGQVLFEVNDTTKQSSSTDTNRKQTLLTVNFKDNTQKQYKGFTAFYHDMFDINETTLKEIYNENDFKTGINDKDINSRILWHFLTETTGKTFKHTNLIEKFSENEIKEIFENTQELKKIASIKYEKLLNNEVSFTKEINFKFDNHNA